jgi:DNA-binding CsgD family transcriptional regulator
MAIVRWSAELAERARRLSSAAEFRGLALATCRRLVPSDRGVFTEVRRQGTVTALDVDRESLDIIDHCERNIARYASDVRPVYQASRDSGGCLDCEVYSSRDRRELPFFCDIVRPQGVRSTIVLIPRWRGEMLGMLRLERTHGQPFRARDLTRALSLLPTIELGLAAFRFSADRGNEGAAPLGCLSPREAEVARHVARGLTTAQIALLLGTSPMTVRNQISRIFDKARVASRAELATWLSHQRDGAFVPSSGA